MEFGLTQHVTLPTRGDRLLDVVVSDVNLNVQTAIA